MSAAVRRRLEEGTIGPNLVRKARRDREPWADGLTAMHLTDLFFRPSEYNGVCCTLAASDLHGLGLLARAESNPEVLYSSVENAAKVIDAYLRRAPADRLVYLRG